MNNSLEKELTNSEDIVFIEPDKAYFKATDGGFLTLHIKPDRNYERVDLFKAFPFSRDRNYISVRTVEGKEIGIIKSLENFPEETVKLLEAELDRRYFFPVIDKIHSIKEEFGYSYWDVQTSAGRRKLALKKGQNCVVSIGNNRLMAIDVDGNRFEIPDYTKLEAKYRRIIETML